VRQAIGVPVLTDVHDIPEIAPVAAVVDVLQTPRSCAARRILSSSRRLRQAGEYQEGPVSRARRHEECRRQGE